MATKKITSDVEQVLRDSRVEGNLLFLPPRQLDPKLYRAVNDVLVSIGGAWKGGKVKAHVFSGSPADALATVLETGEKPPKNPLDFFATPWALAERLIEHARVAPGMSVLEPSAGEGAILDRLARYDLSPTIAAVELDPGRAAILRAKGYLNVFEADFLAPELPFPPASFDRVLMNPPFTSPADPLAYIAHIKRAFLMLAPGGRLVSIAPGGFAYRADARTRTFRDFVATNGGWEELGASAFRESGTDAATVVLWLDHEDADHPDNDDGQLGTASGMLDDYLGL